MAGASAAPDGQPVRCQAARPVTASAAPGSADCNSPRPRNVIRQNAECNSSRVNYIPHFRIREQVLDFRDGVDLKG